MAPELFLADTPDHLLERLVAALAADRSRALLHSTGIPRLVPVLAPSSQLADWLQAELARRTGIGIGLRFASSIDEVLADAGEPEPETEWTEDRLRWRILEHVDAFRQRLGYDPDAELPARERFACACLLASQLNRTLRLRPEWAAAWRANRDALPASATETARTDERWQRELWLRLAHAPGMPPHPAELLQAALPAPGETPPPLHHVSTGRIDPFTLAQLQRLARSGRPVRMHLLLPSLGFLGDIPSRSRLASLAAAARPAEPVALPGHPLLSSLGQQAVGTFLLMERTQPDYADWDPAPETAADCDGPLLRRLQHAIRNQNPVPETGPAPLAPSDFSLRVHSCHGPRRELEVLRDELLAAFQRMPDLRPSDILVASTDFDLHAPLVDGILNHGNPPLPVRMTAIDAREANPVAAGLHALLAFSHGRATVSSLIELIALRAVRLRLEVDDSAEDAALLADTLRASGMTHGLGTGAPSETGTLRSALDRILAGAWLGADAPALDASGQWVHPLAAALASPDDPRQRLAEWLARMLRHLLGWSVPAPAATWAARLNAAVDDLLDSDEIEDHTAAARRLLRELDIAPSETPLDVGAVLDWLAARLDNETSLRTSLDGSILFARLEQVQALPCRVLAIVGLQDGSFPRSPRRPAWDLPSALPERWDDDARARDLQHFLNALLAPKDQLLLLAGNRSLRTNNDAPLAAPVSELLRAVDRLARPADPRLPASAQVLVRHRLHPFDAGYFLADSPLVTYAATAARVARLASGPGTPPAPFLQQIPETASALPRAVSIDELVAFWRSPSRAWLRALGVARDAEDADDRSLDSPPVQLDSLAEFFVRSERIALALEGREQDANRVRSRLAADRGLPPGTLGDLAWDAALRKAQPFLDAFVPLHLPSEEISCALETTACGAVFRIHGNLRLRSRNGAPPQLLIHRAGKFERKPKYQIDAWIRALCASAQLGAAAECVVGSVGDEPVCVKAAIDPDSARMLLALLMKGWSAGRSQPIAFAPAASTAMLTALGVGEHARALADARRSWQEEGDHADGGEGFLPENQVVWRDLDPFSPPHGDRWIEWADRIARPLSEWWGSTASLEVIP